MREFACALAVLVALTGCTSARNRKVERPVTYQLHVKNFEGKLKVLELVELEGRVEEYSITTEGSELYVDAP